MSIQVHSLHLPLNRIRTTNASPLPGGKKILTRVAGKDASKQFWKYHNDGILKKYKAKLQVGSLDTKKQEAAAPPTPPPSPPVPKEEAVKPSAESGAVVPVPASGAVAAVEEESEPLDPYGDLIPFADPSWYQGVRFPLRPAPSPTSQEPRTKRLT